MPTVKRMAEEVRVRLCRRCLIRTGEGFIESRLFPWQHRPICGHCLLELGVSYEIVQARGEEPGPVKGEGRHQYSTTISSSESTYWLGYKAIFYCIVRGSNKEYHDYMARACTFLHQNQTSVSESPHLVVRHDYAGGTGRDIRSGGTFMDSI